MAAWCRRTGSQPMLVTLRIPGALCARSCLLESWSTLGSIKGRSRTKRKQMSQAWKNEPKTTIQTHSRLPGPVSLDPAAASWDNTVKSSAETLVMCEEALHFKWECFYIISFSFPLPIWPHPADLVSRLFSVNEVLFHPRLHCSCLAALGARGLTLQCLSTAAYHVSQGIAPDRPDGLLVFLCKFMGPY